MAGLRLSDLPLPTLQFDPERCSPDEKGRALFESTADALKEDRNRVKLLVRQGRKTTPLMRACDVRLLGRRLAAPHARSTAACARHMHDLRRRIVGAAWKLVQEEPEGHICTARLIPQGLEVRPSELGTWTAAALMNRLRSQINRAEARMLGAGPGGRPARGWLLAGLHCEFDPTAQLYQFHYHAIASAHMVAVLDQLREATAYRRQREGRVRSPVWLSRGPLTRLPAPLGYPWQLFWPSRPRGDGSDAAVGFNLLNRVKQRIPDPFHSQQLLWLDQERIENMTLMMGLRVGCNGFQKTYTDGEDHP